MIPSKLRYLGKSLSVTAQSLHREQRYWRQTYPCSPPCASAVTTQQIPPGSHQAEARLVPGRQHSTSCSSTGLLFSRWARETDFQPAESRELAQKPPQPPSTAWSLPLTSSSSSLVMFMLCHTPSCHRRNDKCIKKQGAALGGCLLLWLQTIHLADQNSACLCLFSQGNTGLQG